ncbi:MAG: efflux RND transporter permease subunit [Gammaproteobacteria bacterium]
MTADFERALSQRIVAYRWWLLLLIPVLVIILGAGAQHLHITTNYRVFFSPENPQLQAFEEMERTYNQDDNVLFLVVPDSGDVFDAGALTALHQLTDRAWRIPYSLRVDSITNFQHTEAEGDDLVVLDLVDDPAQLDQAGRERVAQTALAEPLLRGRLIAPDRRAAAVAVTIQLPRKDETVEVPEVAEFARMLKAETEQAHPGVKVYLSGMVIMNNAFSESSKGDMQFLVPISLAVMLLVLTLLTRSLWATIATSLVLFMSIAVSMGISGWIGFPITPPSASAPTIILTVAIASSVHILVSHQQYLGRGLERLEAMRESLRVNLQPVFLTSLTTAIGFLSMNFSDAPPFRHLGNMVAMGVVASFVLVITFLPALICVLPDTGHASVGRRGSRAIDRFAEFVIRRRKGVFWTMLLLIVVIVAQVPRNELNDIFVHYFDESVEFRQDADTLDEYLGGLYRVDYSLDSEETGGISEPRFLGQVEAFADWLRAQPEVIHVNTLTDTMKRLNRNMHGDDDQYRTLPDSRELAAQYLLLYEMSLPYGLDLNNQIDVGKQATRLTVTLRILSTRQVLDLERRAQNWLLEHAPSLQTRGASPTIMFAHIGERNIRSMLGGTSIALLLISLILVLALRSMKVGMISLVPNLVPAAMGFGLWGVMVGEVGLALSVVSGMTLGIVVDDTVHFLSKYLRARREQGLGSQDAVRDAFHNVGSALLITTLVLIAGFLVLALSSFHLNSGMGLMTAVVLALALIADFLFLPTLLMRFDEDKAHDAPADPDLSAP